MCVFFSLADRFSTDDNNGRNPAAAPVPAPDQLAPAPQPAPAPAFSAADQLRAHALGVRL